MVADLSPAGAVVVADGAAAPRAPLRSRGAAAVAVAGTHGAAVAAVAVVADLSPAVGTTVADGKELAESTPNWRITPAEDVPPGKALVHLESAEVLGE